MPRRDLTPEGSDASVAAALLEPGETILRLGPAERSMQRAGVVAVAWAVPVFAIGWFPLRKVAAHGHSLGTDQPLWPLVLFAAFGLFWIAVGTRLLWEPWRLHRLYPHVVHLLTDRRFVAIDRRTGPIRQIALADIRQMKTFPPFGRLTVWRLGLVTSTGARARVRDFDGVADVDAVARQLSQRTGVPVGMGRPASPRTSDSCR